MNDAEKLTKIIKYAVERGYKQKTSIEASREWTLNGMLLDHDFCKAVFGEIGTSDMPQSHISWKYNIQRLALSDDRIDYLWKFMEENPLPVNK